MQRKLLNGNQLKVIAIIAITIDHIASVLFPNYPTDWWVIVLHIIGRLAAPLFWGLIALVINDSTKLKQWQKTLLILGITVIAFCSDWSCIAILAILQIGENRGNFKKQMQGMMIWVSVYAIVYAIFIHPVYGILQLFVALTIPLLKMYNGERGNWKGMKWVFYIYYPLHLVLCGLIRIALYGNIGVMIGG